MVDFKERIISIPAQESKIPLGQVSAEGPPGEFRG